MDVGRTRGLPVPTMPLRPARRSGAFARPLGARVCGGCEARAQFSDQPTPLQRNKDHRYHGTPGPSGRAPLSYRIGPLAGFRPESPMGRISAEPNLLHDWKSFLKGPKGPRKSAQAHTITRSALAPSLSRALSHQTNRSSRCPSRSPSRERFFGGAHLPAA